MATKELAMDGLKALVVGIKADADSAKQAPVMQKEGPRAVTAETGEGSAASGGHRGRPRGSVKNVRERRPVSCKMLEQQYSKIGLMAGLAGCSRQDIMDEAYARIIESFERENGPLEESAGRPYGKFNRKF